MSAIEQPVKEQRRTRQRVAVDEVLDETADFVSAQELHAALRSRGAGVGLATVYRTLQNLADSGRVDVLRAGGGETFYRKCVQEEHHHHLVCRSCGATVEIAGPAVERWTKAVAEQHGYVDVSHTIEVFGTCQGCAAAAGR